MTQVVTVHTDFTDLNQMAQGLVGRVNETHVILPGPEPVDTGDWIEFAVTLYDGTPGFAGVGRCVTVVDNGEDRLSHQRFDVVIDSLQFDSRGQQVFEHILTLNGGGSEYVDQSEAEEVGGHEPDEQAAFDESLSYVDVSSEFTGSRIDIPSAEPDAREDEHTAIGDSPVFETAPPAAVQSIAPSYADDEDEDEDGVTVPPPRVSAEPAQPKLQELAAPHTEQRSIASVAPPAVSNGHSNGVLFAYHEGLPLPKRPPRPELDASLKVSPAPRPTPDAH